MGRPGYCTREQTKLALDSAVTARDDDQVDRAVLAAPETIDAVLHVCHVDPRTATRRFDWPNEQRARSWRLWLEEQMLLDLTSATSGGVTLTGLKLEPVNEGPPYDRVETNLAGSSSFETGNTPQQSILLAGLWGLGNDLAPAGALAGALGTTTGTAVTVNDGSKIGVWSLIAVEAERMIVTAKDWVDTGVNMTGDLDPLSSDTIVGLTTGTSFHVGEELLIDGEAMLLVGIAGNNGIARRAVDGSVLAAHAGGADIFARRALTVERGASGSTAATHVDATAVQVWRPPFLLNSWAIAETQCQVLNEQAAYGRTVGSGDNQREAAGRQLQLIRDRAEAAWGRVMRTGAV